MRSLVVVVLVLIVAVLLLALYNTSTFPFTDIVITTSTSTILTTTTTSAATAATITPTTPATLLADSSFSAAELFADNVTDESIAWLEQRTFELVNEERTKRGLSELKWNDDVVEVCRAHSKDMAEHSFFSHTGSDGSNVSVRLRNAEIYYWNLSGENILMESGVDYYITNLLGKIRKVEYNTFEELAREAVEGWMNSIGHRDNILLAEFDEAAMGVYVLQSPLLESSYLNVSYYFTQDFISRIECGYKGGSCCKTAGYLPWCYKPWKCVSGVCQ